MNFLNIKLSDDISRHTIKKILFKTNVLLSNKEWRNSCISNPQNKYIINYSKLNIEMTQNLISFFYIVRGRLYSFRFKDFSDYSVKNTNNKNFEIYEENTIFEEESFAYSLRLIKSYFYIDDQNSKKLAYQKIISKPVLSTFVFYIDGERDENFEGFKFDENSGLIYLKNNINLDKFNIEFEFDICVRFFDDEISISNISNGINDIKEVQLIEVFE